MSTVELIKFSFHQYAKKLHFVSTVSSIVETDSKGYGIESVSPKQPANTQGGYVLTKWVSEQLMQKAFENGMKGTILRPGNIYVHTKTNVTSNIDSNYSLMLLRVLLKYRMAPDIDVFFESIPVDILAHMIAAITEVDESNRHAFNLSNPNIMSFKSYMRLINKVFQINIRFVSFKQWKSEVIDHLSKQDKLYPLTLYFQDEPSKELAHFETTRTERLLKRLELFFPKNYELQLTQIKSTLHD